MQKDIREDSKDLELNPYTLLQDDEPDEEYELDGEYEVARTKRFHAFSPPSRSVKISAALVAVFSAYGEGIFKGAQILDGLPIFLGIEGGNTISLPLRLLVFPLVPFLGGVSLLYRENKEALAAPLHHSRTAAVLHELKSQPLGCTLIAIAASVEGLIFANSMFALLKDDSPDNGLAWIAPIGLGMFGFLQYIFADGKELLKRMSGSLIYSTPEYKNYLQGLSTTKRRLVKTRQHLFPLLDALIFGIIAFGESRELIARLFSSPSESYRSEVGNIVGFPLAIVYMMMRYAFYGYGAQVEIVQGLLAKKIDAPAPISKLRRLRIYSAVSIAALGALAQGLTGAAPLIEFWKTIFGHYPSKAGIWSIALLTAPIGIMMNWWMDGKALIDFSKNIPHNTLIEEEENLDEKNYYDFKKFLPDVASVAVFTLSRSAIQRILIDSTAVIQEWDLKVILSAYLFCSVAGMVVWFTLNELPRFRHLYPPFLNVEIQSTDRPLSTEIKKENERQRKEFIKTEYKASFYRSSSRLMTQILLHLTLPIFSGLGLETLFYYLFSSKDHLNIEEALDQGQLYSGFFSALLSVIAQHQVDSFFLYCYRVGEIKSYMISYMKKLFPKKPSEFMQITPLLEVKQISIASSHPQPSLSNQLNIEMKVEITMDGLNSAQSQDPKTFLSSMMSGRKNLIIPIAYQIGHESDPEYAFVLCKQAKSIDSINIEDPETKQRGLSLDEKTSEPLNLVYYSPTNNTQLWTIIQQFFSQIPNASIQYARNLSSLSTEQSGPLVSEQIRHCLNNPAGLAEGPHRIVQQLDPMLIRRKHNHRISKNPTRFQFSRGSSKTPRTNPCAKIMQYFGF